MSTCETEAQVYPAIANFQTVLTAIGAWCDGLYLIKMRTALCHVFFLPDACLLGPALLLSSGDANENNIWPESLYINAFDSSDMRLYMYIITSCDTAA
jgi:hypothetical protein